MNHARIVLCFVGSDALGGKWHHILTPDGDMYDEDLAMVSADLISVEQWGAGRTLPVGVVAGNVYDFRAIPTSANLHVLVGDAVRYAILERLRSGLTVPAAVPAAAAAPAGPGVLPPVIGGGVGGVGGGAFGGAAAGGVGGGIAALAAVLGGPAVPIVAPLMAPLVAPPALLAPAVLAAGAPMVLAAPIAAAAPPPADGDIRIHPPLRNSLGERNIDFRVAVERLSLVTWPDSPMKGPATIGWVLNFMLVHGGTPRGWHQKWKTLGKFTDTDAGVAAHESFCHLLEVMTTYDQVNAGSLVCAEVAARNVQMTEERWKDRIAGGGNDVSLDAHLYSGIGGRGNLCICPALNEWIADEMKKEAAVLKERRKAREERAAASKSKPGG